ncbi:hypothetical protein, partial [Raoultella ornithinolytica]|uniref:hypothetical protein n=1 Tax=Raoultella ornithinolytica TaxID=54291 RepID=UPI003F192C16
CAIVLPSIIFAAIREKIPSVTFERGDGVYFVRSERRCQSPFTRFYQQDAKTLLRGWSIS